METSKSTLRSWLWLIVVALAVVAGFIGVWLGDVKSDFWLKHTLLAGILAGALVLLVTVFGVDEILRRRLEASWSGVAKVGYGALVIFTRDVATTIAALYCHSASVVKAKEGGWNWDSLTPVRELQALPDWRSGLTILHSGKLAEDNPQASEVLPRRRLSQLLVDQQWVERAIIEVQRLQDQGLNDLRAWATLMVSAESPRDRIVEVAELLGHLRKLDLSLQQHKYALRRGDPGAARGIILVMELVDVEARVVTNHLWEAAGEKFRFLVAAPPQTT